MQYVAGILIILFGIALIIKTPWFLENFGHSAWAEEKFRTSGGTRTMFKLLGIVLIFFGFLLVTNMIGGFLNATVVKLFVRNTN